MLAPLCLFPVSSTPLLIDRVEQFHICVCMCVWLLADAFHMFLFLSIFATMISIMDIIMILVAINVQNNWSDFVVLDCSFFCFCWHYPAQKGIGGQVYNIHG